jgi:hypothetical protein
MTRAHVKAISIATGQNQSPLSKGQKTFNTLIKQIEQRRARLSAWEAAIPPYRQKYAGELVPLVEALEALQAKMAYSLDRAIGLKGITKTERNKIAHLITSLARELLEGRDDAELKALFNKHSRTDYDDEEAASLKDAQSALEEMLGVELGDDVDMNSPEDLLKRVEAHVQERQAQYEADRQAQEERLARRKKSAKQLTREAQKHAEEAQISQSIREVYRKLASALHPDREPDPVERDRKTVLMQRTNLAYGNNDLLQLLELQLELEHIDQAALNSLSESRLKHFNKILKDQLGELEQEIQNIEGGFKAQFHIPPYFDLPPSALISMLTSDITSVQLAIRGLKIDLIEIEDAKKFKAWLKALRHRPGRENVDDLFR